MRFLRARLTTFDDPHYRAYVERMTMSRENQRAIRPPRQRDLFGSEAEALLRQWLVDQGLSLSERRILEYEERRDRNAIRKYRELDALIEQERALHIFEVKASRTAMALRRAQTQLREIRGALKVIATTITTTLLLVDTGIPTAAEVAALMRQPDAPPLAPLTLAEMLAQQSSLMLVERLDQIGLGTNTIHVVRFTLPEIVAMAGDQPLHLDWEADEHDELPPPPPPIIHTIGTDDDDDNPFAAALRRAMED